MRIRVVAIVLGLLALAGTIILAVAGASSPHSNAMGPIAFLACVIAVVVMILLGVTVGGRNNPRRAPHRFADTSLSSDAQSSDAQSSNAQAEAATGERDRATEAP